MNLFDKICLGVSGLALIGILSLKTIPGHTFICYGLFSDANYELNFRGFDSGGSWFEAKLDLEGDGTWDIISRYNVEYFRRFRRENRNPNVVSILDEESR